MGVPLIFNISKVTILRVTDGPDLIQFQVDGPSPFPAMAKDTKPGSYSPVLEVRTAHRHAEEWLEQMGIALKFSIIKV